MGLFDKIFDVLKTVSGDVESQDDLPADVVEKINNLIAEGIATTGENLKLGGVHVTGSKVYAYSHPGDKVVSLVYHNGDDNVAKELALQIAALNPDYLSFDEVPADEKAKLEAQFTEELKAAGKPENMIANIVKGKVDKAFADNVLLEQEYIRDGGKKVKEILPAGFEITKFYRFSV